MSDPYKVLGVSYDASDDEIKRVYRELVKKYHPDNYQGSPLADLAQEKMAEINSAYDTIVKQREAGAAGGNSYNPYSGYQDPFGYGGAYQGSYGQGGQFQDIRRMINAGKLLEAQEILEGISPSSRDAEWYFLKGYVLYARGFLEDAYPYFQRAVQMDPGNREYQDMLGRINTSRQNGFTGNSSYRECSPCNPCGICATAACLQCCGCPGYFCCI